ncbi:MAG TPA: multicopper oxidase domain-containing protein [Terriglobales bacterium]|nr:multicopper oxidase domain-containing protein [Terriglobales bacterium]
MSFSFNRRSFLGAASTFGIGAALRSLTPAYAQGRSDMGLTRVQPGPKEVNLVIREEWIPIAEGRGRAVTVNGTTPGPILRFHEGDDVTIHVKNEMSVTASIHSHGILLPFNMDGVPAVSFPGIRAGETFTYRYKLRQSGTYWYHSHSAFQEQSGLLGPFLIDPVKPESYQYDREYVVQFSDWTFEDPDRVIAKVKKLPEYYNFQQRTAGDFFRDISRQGFRATLADRLMWGRMSYALWTSGLVNRCGAQCHRKSFCGFRGTQVRRRGALSSGPLSCLPSPTINARMQQRRRAFKSTVTCVPHENAQNFRVRQVSPNAPSWFSLVP